MVPALLIVVIRSSPAQPPLPDMSAVIDPVAHQRISLRFAAPQQISRIAPGSPKRIQKVSTPAPTRYAHKPL
jgi:hypothetical protein